MSRSGHPHNAVAAAIKFAVSRGWSVQAASGNNHAKHIRRAIIKCQHAPRTPSWAIRMTRKAKPTNPEHDFALIATGVDDLSEDLLARIYERGCDDATVSMRHGLVYLEFSRRAPSIEQAILSAIREVQRADAALRVLRVDECNLVTQAEIARRIGQSRQSVNQYISGARGPGDFPSPACDIDEDNPLYAWCEVSQWFVDNQLLQPEASWNAQVIHTINTSLDAHSQLESHPELVRQIKAALFA